MTFTELERDQTLMDRENSVRQLMQNYANTTDDKDLDTWTKLFATPGSYIVTTHENVARGLPLAFVLDDSNDRIIDRVTYIREVWKGHYNDYRQRHILGQSMIKWHADIASVRTSFAVYIAQPGAVGSTVLATGEYHDEVVFESGQPRLRSKKVIIDGDVLPRSFVYPL
jgi:3-phenylpropionate/cinnamic acid dioxygenase small subunit